MAVPELRAIGRELVRTVAPDCLRRVWSYLDEHNLDTKSLGGFVMARVVADLCQPGEDFSATYFRVLLLQSLREQGRLQPWQEGKSLHDSVFELAGRFPLRGPIPANLDSFIVELQMQSQKQPEQSG